MFRLKNRMSTFVTVKPEKGEPFKLLAKEISWSLADEEMSDMIRMQERKGVLTVIRLDPQKVEIKKIVPAEKKGVKTDG